MSDSREQLDDLESNPRQLECARTLALPQALSLDFSPAILTSILGCDPPVSPFPYHGEDPVKFLAPVVARRPLLELCQIRVVLARPARTAHNADSASFPPWLEWCNRQGIAVRTVPSGLICPWRMITWSQLAIQSVVCLAAVNSQWLQLLLGGLQGKPFFAVPTGELAEAFFCVTPLDECTITSLQLENYR